MLNASQMGEYKNIFRGKWSLLWKNMSCCLFICLRFSVTKKCDHDEVVDKRRKKHSHAELFKKDLHVWLDLVEKHFVERKNTSVSLKLRVLQGKRWRWIRRGVGSCCFFLKNNKCLVDTPTQLGLRENIKPETFNDQKEPEEKWVRTTAITEVWW